MTRVSSELRVYGVSSAVRPQLRVGVIGAGVSSNSPRQQDRSKKLVVGEQSFICKIFMAFGGDSEGRTIYICERDFGENKLELRQIGKCGGT